MPSRLIINLSLLVFAGLAIILLFKYTNVTNVGFVASVNESIQNIRKMIQESPPDTRLSEVEKTKLKNVFKTQKTVFPLFCESAYLPFVAGANWSYQVEKETGNDVIKMGIPQQENGVIFLDGRLASREKWTNRTMATCKGNKIRLTDFNFLLIWDRDRTVTTPCVKDQYDFSFPDDAYLVKGNAWSEKGCLIHEVLNENYKDKELEIKEDLEVKGKVLGTEKLTVPAGEFTAQNIKLSLVSRQTAYHGNAAESETGGERKTVESTVEIWVAQGVGIVKAVYQGISGDKPPVTQELISFQIPTERGFKSPGR